MPPGMSKPYKRQTAYAARKAAPMSATAYWPPAFES